MNNLSCGGAEKALISLLQTIDYSIYNVDLFLFKREGVFLNQVPSEVNILEQPKNYHYFDMPLKKAVIENIFKGKFKIAFYRILAGYIFKTEKIPANREQKLWKILKQVIDPIYKTYDVAIGYLENTPNYFCIDKVNAKIKIGFIHNDYNELKINPKFDLPYFENFDKIVTVSKECETVLIDTFPTLKDKFEVMYNIISSKTINNLSKSPIGFNPKDVSLISIGRLNKQKGYDLAIKACKILVEKKLNITWYVLGDGEEKEYLKNLIIKNNLNDKFILLGIKENPYPYLKKADIFVHTARFEGFGIVLTEAKILNKPIVTTNFNIAKTHIIHGINGLISDMNPESIAKNIEILYNDIDKQKLFTNNLKSKDYGNEYEISKFYQIINNSN